MASALGTLVAKVILDTAEFTSGADKAKYQAAQLAGEVDRSLGAIERKVTGAMAGIGAALAAGFAVSSLKSTFDSYAEGAARLVDLSEKAGVSVKFLAGISPVAKLSGTSLDELAGMMDKLSKGLVNSNKETAGAGHALAFLGISSKDAQGNLKDAGTITEEVAIKLAGLTDGMAKSTIVMDLYGKTGASLKPFLKDLAEFGVQDVAITTQQAAIAKQYEQDLVRLGIAKAALGKTISKEVLPVADAFVQSLLQMFKGTGGVREKVDELAKNGGIRDFAMAGVNAFGLLLNAGDSVTRVFTIVGDSIGAIVARAGNVLGTLGTALVQFIRGDYSAAWDTLKSGTARDSAIVNDAAGRVRETLEKPLAGDAFVKTVQANLDAIDVKMQATAKSTTTSADAYKKLGDSKLLAASDALIATLEKELIKINALSGEATKYAQTLIDIAKLKKEGKPVDEDRALALAKEIDDTIRLRLETAAYNKVLDDLDAYEQARIEHARVLVEKLEDENAKTAFENGLIGQNAAQMKLANIEYERRIALKGVDNQIAIDRINALYDERTALAKTGEALNAESSMWSALGNAAGNFLNTLLSRTKSVTEAVRDMVKQLVIDVAAYLSKQFVLQLVVGAAGAGSTLANAASSGLASMGSSALGTALTGINQFGGSLIGSSTLTGGISSAVFGTSALTGAGDFVGTGLAGLAGNAALAAGATDAFAASVAAAVPVIGWIVAIGAVLYGIFGSKGGAPKGGGSFDANFDASGAMTSPTGQRYFTPSGSDAQLATAGRGVASSYYGTLASLGGRAGATSFGIGFDTDPGGSAPNRISAAASVNGRQVFSETNRDIGRDQANLAPEMQLTASRMVLAALQASDLPAYLTKMLNSVTASTATQEQINGVLAGAQALKTVFSIASTNPLATVAQNLSDASNVFQTSLKNNEAALRAVMKAYDGSAASAVNLETATRGYYNAQLQLLAGISVARDAIAGMFESTFRNIRLAGMDKQQQYNFYQQEAASLQKQALAANDPEQIKSLAARINADIQAAFGLLSPEQQKAQGAAFLEQGSATQKALDARLEKLQKDAADKVQKTLDDLKTLIAAGAEDQKAAGAAQKSAAATQLAAAQTVRQLAITLPGGGQQVTSFG